MCGFGNVLMGSKPAPGSTGKEKAATKTNRLKTLERRKLRVMRGFFYLL
jgi:hypothetical protein